MCICVYANGFDEAKGTHALFHCLPDNHIRATQPTGGSQVDIHIHSKL